jgi:hypothetical protein
MENSSFGRLIGVLVAPQKTFRSIAERPTWLVAFLVVCLLPLLTGVVANQKIDWEEFARYQLERAGADLNSPEAKQQLEWTPRLAPFFVYATPLFMTIGILVLSLVFWGAFTLAGGEAGFKRSLAVVSHGMMPFVVGALLSVPVILGMDSIPPETIEQGSYLKSSLAALAPEDAGVVLVALLSKFDLFTIWSLVLYVIGFTWAAKVKPRTAVITVGLLWLLWIVVSVGFASLGALMGSKRG